MAPEAINPDDPRIEHRFLKINDDITYHYMLAKPQTENPPPLGTVLLLHGWPDIGMGWRFQVLYLLSLGLQVIVPDLLGYGQTSAPDAFVEYSLRKMSAHMAHLVRDVVPDPSNHPVILGGHDWGAFLAWRLAIYHPDLFCGVFSFTIPFFPPAPTVVTLDDFVQQNPIFGYQLQNANGEAEAIGERHLRGFINTMHRGVSSDGESAFDPYVGLIEDRLANVGPSPLMTPEIFEHYVQEFSRHGLHGPMNWYRTRSINGEDETQLAAAPTNKYAKTTTTTPTKFQFPSIPAMLVMAGKDSVLSPQMAAGQEQYFSAGLKSEVIADASHWAMTHQPDEANRLIGEFVKQVLGL
ncbi:Alpha/Beta hydrolase protein [Podospora didyma]|uniref:Alpha/Beta hydrolase protein n=1 Tax=Podospora didyma TaxID=330526 RepID=A0AAE0NNU1_9PEZI|nr:Alpha/Beta hydrolase protein [Podospora didyma]